jgi:hypothetical protein
MNTHSVLLSVALCLSPLSALAGASSTPNSSITLAQLVKAGTMTEIAGL